MSCRLGSEHLAVAEAARLHYSIQTLEFGAAADSTVAVDLIAVDCS